MEIEPFQLEIYFARHEFSAKYLLCCSDAESMAMNDLIHLATNDTNILWRTLRLGYTETRGHPKLLEECAKEYPQLNESNILCFAGGEEGIFCTMKALLQPEHHAVVITPCYQSLLSIPKSICSVSMIDLEFTGTWRINFDVLKALITSQTTAIIINFPHNPTGSIISKHDLDKLVSIARQNNLWIFCDEMYRGIELNPDDTLPSIVNIYEKGISLGGMSKIYGMAGLRVGWIVCQDKELLQKIADSKHYLSICNSGPSEILSIMAIQAKEHITSKIKTIIASNLAYLDVFLHKYSHIFSWVKPLGGCCGFIKMNLSDPPNFSMNTFAEKLVQDHGVLILPGENFPTTDHNKDTVKYYFRIGFGRSNFKEVLDVFEQAFVIVLQHMNVKF